MEQFSSNDLVLPMTNSKGPQRRKLRTGARERLNRREKIMKLSHFFIDRPIFAIVISIVTVLLGVNCLFDLAGGPVSGDCPADGGGPSPVSGGRS